MLRLAEGEYVRLPSERKRAYLKKRNASLRLGVRPQGAHEAIFFY
jgi:hypothetical protein